MKICPYCNKELEFENYIKLNLECYHKTRLVSTPCCKKPVILKPIFDYNVLETETDRIEDDWGNEFIK